MFYIKKRVTLPQNLIVLKITNSGPFLPFQLILQNFEPDYTSNN
jgi:hypothetical protein